ECCADAAQRDRVRAKDRAWSALFDAAAAIRACAFARLSGASSERLEPLRTAALAALGVASAAPKFARMALERHWTGVAAGEAARDAAADPAANASALRLLCIRAELATERVTPAEDAGRRREYQLRRLVDARNLGVDTAPENLEDLAVEWLTIGPVDPVQEAPLRARFEQCRMAIAPCGPRRAPAGRNPRP
ncbi:MAG: hypothetical protein IT480_08535, partial [Gammaproteobacteria bacterium]|nr:hypothetical protein [Gammaproteobacteria bacterium]